MDEVRQRVSRPGAHLATAEVEVNAAGVGADRDPRRLLLSEARAIVEAVAVTLGIAAEAILNCSSSNISYIKTNKHKFLLNTLRPHHTSKILAE